MLSKAFNKNSITSWHRDGVLTPLAKLLETDVKALREQYLCARPTAIFLARRGLLVLPILPCLTKSNHRSGEQEYWPATMQRFRNLKALREAVHGSDPAAIGVAFSG